MTARELPPIADGTEVWIIDLQREGTVERKAQEPRSYWVATERESVRRNREHLLALPERQPPTATINSKGKTTMTASSTDAFHMRTRSGKCLQPRR